MTGYNDAMNNLAAWKNAATTDVQARNYYYNNLLPSVHANDPQLYAAYTQAYEPGLYKDFIRQDYIGGRAHVNEARNHAQTRRYNEREFGYTLHGEKQYSRDLNTIARNTKRFAKTWKDGDALSHAMTIFGVGSQVVVPIVGGVAGAITDGIGSGFNRTPSTSVNIPPPPSSNHGYDTPSQSEAPVPNTFYPPQQQQQPYQYNNPQQQGQFIPQSYAPTPQQNQPAPVQSHKYDRQQYLQDLAAVQNHPALQKYMATAHNNMEHAWVMALSDANPGVSITPEMASRELRSYIVAQQQQYTQQQTVQQPQYTPPPATDNSRLQTYNQSTRTDAQTPSPATQQPAATQQHHTYSRPNVDITGKDLDALLHAAGYASGKADGKFSVKQGDERALRNATEAYNKENPDKPLKYEYSAFPNGEYAIDANLSQFLANKAQDSGRAK